MSCLTHLTFSCWRRAQISRSLCATSRTDHICLLQIHRGISNGIRYLGLGKPNLLESYVTVPHQKSKESLRLEEMLWYLGSFGQVNCLCPSSMPAATVEDIPLPKYWVTDSSLGSSHSGCGRCLLTYSVLGGLNYSDLKDRSEKDKGINVYF